MDIFSLLAGIPLIIISPSIFKLLALRKFKTFNNVAFTFHLLNLLYSVAFLCLQQSNLLVYLVRQWISWIIRLSELLLLLLFNWVFFTNWSYFWSDASSLTRRFLKRSSVYNNQVVVNIRNNYFDKKAFLTCLYMYFL